MNILLNCIYLILFTLFPIQSFTEDQWQEAQIQFQKGISAQTYDEQKTDFNHALLIFHELESQNPPAHINAALANTYFQLGEYPWAILYNERALQQNPQDSVLMSNLKLAQKKLGIENASPKEGMTRQLMTPPSFQWLFWIILFTFLTISLNLWLNISWLRFAAFCSTLALILALVQLLMAYYLTPLNGIVIQSTGIYREPDWHESQLTSQPLLAGSKVQILQMSENGEWLKIETLSGLIGYIPTARMRSI